MTPSRTRRECRLRRLSNPTSHRPPGSRACAASGGSASRAGWDGRLKRLLEYVGRSDGWDHPDPDKERSSRPLDHFVGPTARPTTFVQFVLKELRTFRHEQHDKVVDVYLSFGVTAGDLDRGTPYKRVQEVELVEALLIDRRPQVGRHIRRPQNCARRRHR